MDVSASLQQLEDERKVGGHETRHGIVKVSREKPFDAVCTPLQLAVWEGTLDCVRLLLEAGADPNAIASDGGTPLSNAMWHREGLHSDD